MRSAVGLDHSKMKLRRLLSKTILGNIQSGVCRSTREILPLWQNRLLQASDVAARLANGNRVFED